jgi:hypothetical protein
MIEVQTETNETTTCDVCSLPFQVGETYMTWRLAFGLLAFHLGCSQTFSRQFYAHMKTIRRQIEETGHVEPSELTQYEQQKRRPMTTHKAEFVTRERV